MKLDFNLRLEQAPKLIITPQLQQAISLLQYSSVELSEYVQEELVDNPVLELEEGADSDFDMQQEKETSEENLAWDDYFQEQEENYRPRSSSESAGHHSLENYTTYSFSLQEYLLSQLQLVMLSPAKYAIGDFLIGNIDRNGYLQGELDELAYSLGVQVQEALAVLQVIQQFEPAGVGARNIEECLLLQIAKREERPPLVEKVIKDHLPELGAGRYRRIAQQLGCSQKQVQEIFDFIRTLEPKPGSFLGDSADNRYVTPDIIVEKIGREYIVIVNDTLSPYLRINPYYQSLLRKGESQASSFLKERLDRALWLIRSIEQRRLTLYRVAEEIVKLQHRFLEEGVKHLRPLTLKDVAERVDMHESTVSRATANKYVQTPRGLFPFKFFFSSCVSNGVGEDFSSRSIKKLLKDIIAREDPRAPYSDQKIVDILREDEITISRRTVAKYREELNIPGSHKRRRL